MIHVQCFHSNGSKFIIIIKASQVLQVTWLIGQLIKPNNLHVSRNFYLLTEVSSGGEKIREERDLCRGPGKFFDVPPSAIFG